MAPKPSRAGGADGTQATSKGKEPRVTRIAKLFTTMQQKGAVWYKREREGIAVLENFQSARLALRDAPGVTVTAAADRENDVHEKAVVLGGLAGNAVMDPWLAEDLYQEVHQLSRGFEDLLEEMCTLQVQAREIVREEDNGDQQVEAMQLRPVDYLQMMSHELATFEAEYQHLEALLGRISFDTSTDELRTLVISWSTSPFLDPAQTRNFLQRHQLSNRLYA